MLIIGDIGGTAAKLALATSTGEIVAQASGPGANVHSAGGLTAFTAAVTAPLADLLATSGVSPQQVALSYFAVSGAGEARIAIIRESLQSILKKCAITTKAIVTNDIVAAFMANTAQRDTGILALSGTGALTAVIKNRRIVQRFDGLGWVLGDIGSGLWFGHQALLACASDLDSTGEQTYLTDLVTEKIHIARASQALIAAVSDQPAAYWAQFAPLVFTAFAAGDKQAARIVTSAVARFAHTITLAADAVHAAENGDALAQPDNLAQPDDLVWAGGVASHTVLPDLVAAELAQRGRHFHRLTAAAPIHGVLALALREYAGAPR